MSACKSLKEGFTLVELLVVLLILSLLVSLAVPQAFRQVERYQRADEKQTLEAIFNDAASESFIRNTPITLIANGQVITKKRGDEVIQHWRFEQFWFEPFEVSVSRFGVFSKCELPLFSDESRTIVADIELSNIRCDLRV